jgi:ribonuclease PH
MDESLRGLERLSSRILNAHVYNNQVCRSKVKVFAKSVNDEGIRIMQEQDTRCSCVLARWIALSDAIAARDTATMKTEHLNLPWATVWPC